MRAWSLLLACTIVASPAMAQLVEVPEESTTEVGTEKAREYFKERKRESSAVASPSAGAAPRFLALHLGSYFSDQGYKWGKGNQEDIGRLNAGVTYRMGEWVNSADWSLRIDFTSFELDDGLARKLSFGAILSFPDANSRFPLYFGGGLGMGFFIKQLEDESPITLDYALFGGARFFDVIDAVGFMVEAGLKNHLHLLSDGQFNGVYFNVGTVFAF